MVYKIHGIPLKRDAYQQAQQGTSLSFVEESQPGDLAFFDNNEGNITHVGILLQNHFILHIKILKLTLNQYMIKDFS